ncbi:FAD-dependent oxidoreductase [Aneurinibacillus migulanus]|uniref:Thioredoxin reductase (NADPH) n=1 Tax=Aneurinibacillus migulanus TaxID=47500 RepID=A0A0K2WG04_ANEMI|nr:FAD-dependent oxidoreductase [Aneurinibacillus migulanus]MED0892962.1 FAD-dependent oxidoreductase [Aneurinibacillus migulanus]MED1614726.1 FAD-dependent oxidoreductase [Aneurinibacillus migulanus]MED4729047.1 FAD-dependent oxidoreductase [Aneurinibacillus migulanus]CEH29673.1 Glutaredoxin [Aneurinibacillus migulanus]SDI12342.1 thioredoxin reductase (NADPH) [Aneurinibacillus migulanus]
MDNNVIVYTSQGCPYCKKVKEQLTAWGIQFDERNVSENYEYFEELQQKKIFGTPATYINGKLVLGFQEAKMKKLLNLPEDFEAPKKEEAFSSDVKSKNEETSAGIFRSVDESILDEVYDLVTIGGGPAGASAAVYAARGRLKTLVIDKAPAAGTLAITHKIANYPGVREELTGLELLQRMQEQAHDFGANFVRTTVLSVDFSDPDIKKLEVAEGTIKAKSVFIAVGAKAPSSKIKGEEEFTGRGVSYCSTCDAAFFQDRTVIVTGDNEEAVHEAEALAKFCKEVRFLIPTGNVKGQADLSTLETKDNVKIYKKYRVKEIIGENSVEKAVVQNDQKEMETWKIDGVFLYLAGMKPGTDFLKDSVARDTEGYINVDDMLQTNVPGVFAGGDARRTPIKQAVLSAADGAIAALGAEAHVNKRSQLRPQYS